MATHAFRPEELPTWALRTELPTLVRETCESAQQISVWLAIRWLMAVRQRRTLGLGSREIADRAKVNVKTVTGTVAALIRLDLLEITGHETITGLGKRPIYRIPRAIESENAAFTWKFIAHYELSTADTPHADQLALPLRDDLDLVPPDPFLDQHADPKTDQYIFPENTFTDPKTDQTDPKTDQHADPKTDHGKEGRKDVGKGGGSRARTRTRKRGRPPNIPPPASPPDPPSGEVPLPAHPADLWAKACPEPRPIDLDHLAALAAEHDTPTAGHGLYWVGRAILAASLVEDVRQVGKVRKILDRWRRGACYGSDLPRKESTDGRTATGARSRPAAVGARPGDDRAPSGERGPIRSTLDY